MRSISNYLLYVVLFCSFSLMSCTDVQNVCIDILRTDGVPVMNTNGEFVDHLEMTVRNVNADKIITPDFQQLLHLEKYIFVTSDEVSDGLVKHNDVLEVTFSDANQTQKAEFVIKADECHVREVIGPETITWNSN